MLSIVTVTYFTGECLFEAIDNILKQEVVSEFIIVNNGNPEEVLTKIKDYQKKFPKIKLVTGHGNIGFSKACNLGARETSSDYILMLNPDCIIQDDCLKLVLNALMIDKNAYMAGCLIINNDNTEQKGCRRNLLTPSTLLSELLRLNKIFKSMKPLNLTNSPLPEINSYIEAISGAFMMFKKDKFLAIGGFDEGYFLHVEDLDICMKIKLAGGKILFVPQAKVMHYLSTSEASSYFIEQHKTNGIIYYFSKFFRKEMTSFGVKIFTILLEFRLLLKKYYL